MKHLEIQNLTFLENDLLKYLFNMTSEKKE